MSPFILMNPAQGEHQNGRLCQSTTPPKRNTTSNLLYFSFDSDASANGRGFKLKQAFLSIDPTTLISLNHTHDKFGSSSHS